ncbi:Ras-related protein Rab-11A [Aphelenchoides fujianensis]|nr:Ras-related protein Rab-11A [Aphelenchoides fujianensis]
MPAPSAPPASSTAALNETNKVIIVGEPDVGKSNLRSRFTYNFFAPTALPTFPVDWTLKRLQVEEASVLLECWDTSREERFGPTAQAFYRGAQGALLVFDVTNRRSFDQIGRFWLAAVEKFAGVRLPVVLVGKKADLEAKRAVERAEAAEFARSNGLQFVETSALLGENVDEAFGCLVEEICRQRATRELSNVIIVGESSARKSNLLSRYIHNTFNPNIQQTFPADFASKHVRFQERNIKLQCWDMCGHERYRSVTKAYYRGAQGALLVFDIADRRSFEQAKEFWLGEIEEHVGARIPIVLVGNKADLEAQRTIERPEALEFARSRGMKFVETSALTPTNVDRAFLLLLREIFEQRTKEPEASLPDVPSATALHSLSPVRPLEETPIRLHSTIPLPTKKKRKCCISS